MYGGPRRNPVPVALAPNGWFSGTGRFTLGFLIHGFWGPAGYRRFRRLGWPWRPQEPFQRVGGEAPPPLGMVVGATPPTPPKFNDSRPAQKPCITNQSVNLPVPLNHPCGATGYLKAVWPEFLGCVFEGLPRPPGSARPQQRIKNPSVLMVELKIVELKMSRNRIRTLLLD